MRGLPVKYLCYFTNMTKILSVFAFYIYLIKILVTLHSAEFSVPMSLLPIKNCCLFLYL